MLGAIVCTHLQRELEVAFDNHKVASDARLARMESQNKYLIKRVAALTDQMGYLTESILRRVRQAVSLKADPWRSVDSHARHELVLWHAGKACRRCMGRMRPQLWMSAACRGCARCSSPETPECAV